MTVGSFEPPVDQVTSGIILPWFGREETLPTGWLLCDGNNGTPDLRDRFPKCVPDSSTDPGARGGTSNISISEPQLPAHAHTSDTVNAGEHNHTIGRTEDTEEGGVSGSAVDGGKDDSDTHPGGSHSHSASVNSTGGNGSYNNEQSHVDVNFIQRA